MSVPLSKLLPILEHRYRTPLAFVSGMSTCCLVAIGAAYAPLPGTMQVRDAVTFCALMLLIAIWGCVYLFIVRTRVNARRVAAILDQPGRRISLDAARGHLVLESVERTDLGFGEAEVVSNRVVISVQEAQMIGVVVNPSSGRALLESKSGGRHAATPPTAADPLSTVTPVTPA